MPSNRGNLGSLACRRPILKSFEFSGEGKSLGAQLVVLAYSSVQAWEQAKTWAKKSGVPEKSLSLDAVTKVEPPCVVYGWDGDE